ncbi:hypothetical protein BH20GEM2_BH20GEM2_04630 [soil metagenome]
MAGDLFYRLPPGTDVLRLRGGDLLLRSDTVAARLEGRSAKLFGEQILPLLDGRRTVAEVAAELSIGTDDLASHLASLAEQGVLRRSYGPAERAPDAHALAPLLEMLEALGVPEEAGRQRLERSRIAVFGLEGAGAHLAHLLARCGVGTLVLVDPYPAEAGDLAAAPLSCDALGNSRQAAMRARIERDGFAGEIVTPAARELGRESVADFARDCDLLVSCFDRGFLAAHHWINRVSIERCIPAVYAEVRGRTALVGPLVIPAETGCYLCYRMRSIACEEDFAAAMEYEEYLDYRKRPALHRRAFLPPVGATVAGILALESLKCLVLPTPPSLAGTVLELDTLTLEIERHRVLRQPGCPACREVV